MSIHKHMYAYINLCIYLYKYIFLLNVSPNPPASSLVRSKDRDLLPLDPMA